MPYSRPEAKPADFSTQARVSLWQDFYRPGGEPEFTAVPFDQPLYILYSSGTTGVPKCIVHGVGGTLLQHVKELGLHTDLTANDCLFYYTTCGWMMWNWLVSGLALGATLVLFDGSPFHPGPERLIELIACRGHQHLRHQCQVPRRAGEGRRQATRNAQIATPRCALHRLAAGPRELGVGEQRNRKCT